MANVNTQSEATSSVTQIVYKAVFENNEKFKQIAEENAAKRRAEEAAREQAARDSAAEAAANSPSVIVDVKSADVSAPTPAPAAAPTPAAPTTQSVNVLA